MMKILPRSIASLLILGASCLAAGGAAAADGQALYASKACITCHGEAGKAPIMPLYPRLAGQNKEYLIQQMHDIKSGKRDNGQAAVMKPIVANLSDDEIAAIAEYLSGVK